MKRRSPLPAWRPATAAIASLAALAAWPRAAGAHPEHYGQSAYIEIGATRAKVELDMSPGAKVASDVVKIIDKNGDGAIDDDEGRAYASAVLADLALVVDGDAVPLVLDNASYPSAKNLATGEDTLRLAFVATFPAREAGKHELTFQNHHRPARSAPQAHAFATTKQIGIQKLERDGQNERLVVTFAVEGAAPVHEPSRLEVLALCLVFVAGGALASLWRYQKARLAPKEQC